MKKAKCGCDLFFVKEFNMHSNGCKITPVVIITNGLQTENDRQMITIERRTVQVSEDEFLLTLVEYCELLKRHSPRTLGIGPAAINKEFKLKLSQIDFYRLSEKLNIRVHRGKFWYVDEILEMKKTAA